jgi:hypothetical protein
VVAGAADEVVETSPFSAENEDTVAGEIEPVVVGCAMFVQSNDPDVLALQFFEGANQIHDPRDAKVFCRAGAGFDCGWADWSGAPLSQDNAIDSRAVGHAQEGSKILWVFNTIERENKAGCVNLAGSGLEQVFESKRFLGSNQRDHTLVRGGTGKLSELFAGLLADADTSLTAFGYKAREPFVLALAGYENVIKAAASRPECLLYRMEAVENFHGCSLDCR